MVRNLAGPNARKEFLNFLAKCELNEKFTFFYMPCKEHRNVPAGFAFINFLSPNDVLKLYVMVKSDYWKEFLSETYNKVPAMSYGRFQGHEELVKHFTSSAVLHEQDPSKRPIFRAEAVANNSPMPKDTSNNSSSSSNNNNNSNNSSSDVLEPSRLPASPQQCSVHNADCRFTRCCRQAGQQCFEKNDYWATCRNECHPGSLNPEDSPQNRQPWTCKPLGPKAESEDSTTDACMDEVVLEILGDDPLNNLAVGTDVEILIGDSRIPAELASNLHRRNNKRVIETSKPESWWRPFRVVLFALATLLGSLGPLAVALYAWRRSAQEQEQAPLGARQVSAVRTDSGVLEAPRSARGQRTQQRRDPFALCLW